MCASAVNQKQGDRGVVPFAPPWFSWCEALASLPVHLMMPTGGLSELLAHIPQKLKMQPVLSWHRDWRGYDYQCKNSPWSPWLGWKFGYMTYQTAEKTQQLVLQLYRKHGSYVIEKSGQTSDGRKVYRAAAGNALSKNH